MNLTLPTISFAALACLVACTTGNGEDDPPPPPPARVRLLESGVNVDLNAIFAVSDSDIWAVGSRGTVIHGDGSRFVQVASNVGSDLYAIGGTSSTDIWAAGGDDTITTDSDVLIHWDGLSWTRFPTPGNWKVEALHVVRSDSVWAMTVNNKVMRWDGQQWSLVGEYTGTGYSIWSVSDQEFYLGTYQLGLGHVVLPNFVETIPGSPRDGSIQSIFHDGIAIWIATDRVLRYAEGAWTTPLIANASLIRRIAGGPTGVWAVGYSNVFQHTVAGFVEVPLNIQDSFSSPTNLALTNTTVWVCGQSGLLARVRIEP